MRSVGQAGQQQWGLEALPSGGVCGLLSSDDSAQVGTEAMAQSSRWHLHLAGNEILGKGPAVEWVCPPCSPKLPRVALGV